MDAFVRPFSSKDEVGYIFGDMAGSCPVTITVPGIPAIFGAGSAHWPTAGAP